LTHTSLHDFRHCRTKGTTGLPSLFANTYKPICSALAIQSRNWLTVSTLKRNGHLNSFPDGKPVKAKCSVDHLTREGRMIVDAFSRLARA